MIGIDYGNLETIRLASRVGYTASSDVVTKLLESGWCNGKDLDAAYALLAKSQTINVTVFFQLPFALRLSSPRLSILWEHCEAEFVFALRDTEKVVPDPSPLPNQLLLRKLPTATQVRLSYTVWGRRGDYYLKYLSEIVRGAPHNRRHLVSAASSWLPDRRPLTAEMYESDLASRLYKESIRLMRKVVASYAVLACAPEARLPEHLANFFIMVKTGRIVLRPRHNVEDAPPIQGSPRRVVVSRRLEASIQDDERWSEYELFLVDAMRQVDGGTPNLAVVQAIMILDWFANTILSDRLIIPLDRKLEGTPELAAFVRSRIWETGGRKSQIRVRTVEKFKEYLPLIGYALPDGLFNQLKQTIELRNSIVHKRQAEHVAPEIAQRAIETAMAVIETLMAQMKLSAKTGSPG